MRQLFIFIFAPTRFYSHLCLSIFEMNNQTEELFRNVSINDDEYAFQRLFEIYYPQLYLYTKRFITDKSVREDIVQDLFFTIWEKRKLIVLTSSVKSYLLSSAKNNCLTYLRKEGYFQQYQAKIAENPPLYEKGTEQLYDMQELQQLLDNALSKLPEAYRLAFVLSRFDNKSTTEIADIMKVSVRTVERYRAHATEILKNELKDYLPIIMLMFNL